jgi:hypothetical protein
MHAWRGFAPLNIAHLLLLCAGAVPAGVAALVGL